MVPKEEFIKVLVELGNKILYIDDEVYIVSELTFADEKVTQFHHFRGKDITEAIKRDQFYSNDKNVIVSVLHNLPEYDYWVSKMVKYKVIFQN